MIFNSIIKLISLFIFVQITINAQNASTYTRTGIGDPRFSYSARTLGMGHSGSSLLNSDYVEFLNPASISSLTRTRIEFSYSLDGIIIQNSSESKYISDGDFKGLTFAFPVSKVYGICVALGLTPYSRLNYKLEQN
jgi:hypothetical protein